MTPLAIVSYDDTADDHDALMLGRILRDAGAELTLAYVRHAPGARHADEHLSQHEAERRLERGARWLGDAGCERRVVISPATGTGLAWLAEAERADLIVFGSDYRTRRGHVAAGRSAQALLEGGPAAVALAPAGYAASGPAQAGDHGVRTIGVLRGTADEAAIETAFSLAESLGAEVIDADRGVDLLVAGSRPEAREGRVMITARAHRAIEEATAPVLVVARGTPLRFETFVTA